MDNGSSSNWHSTDSTDRSVRRRYFSRRSSSLASSMASSQIRLTWPVAVNGEASWLINGRRKTIDRAIPLLHREKNREERKRGRKSRKISIPRKSFFSSSPTFAKVAKVSKKKMEEGKMENDRRCTTAGDGLGSARGIRNSTGVTDRGGATGWNSTLSTP